jgi:hypothetical protein
LDGLSAVGEVAISRGLVVEVLMVAAMKAQEGLTGLPEVD